MGVLYNFRIIDHLIGNPKMKGVIDMHRICGDITGIECARFPAITTVMLEEFIRCKVNAILAEKEINTPTEVYCFPHVLGDTRHGIKYAAMAIVMSGVSEDEKTLFDRLRPFNYKPRVDNGIQRAIVKAYEFSIDKLQYMLEHPKILRKTCLSPKDIEFLYNNRKLQVKSVEGQPHYVFYADMDRILDDFLMDAESDEPIIPNYTVVGIKKLGEKPDSPLSYDVILHVDPVSSDDRAAEVFKALIAR